MRKYRNGKQSREPRQLSKYSPEYIQYRGNRGGYSVKVGLCDITGDGDADTISVAWRNPANGKVENCTVNIPQAQIPASGPNSLTATEAIPANGPSGLTATMQAQAPTSGPSNLTATEQAPASGPSNLTASESIPVSGPSSLTATDAISNFWEGDWSGGASNRNYLVDYNTSNIGQNYNSTYSRELDVLSSDAHTQLETTIFASLYVSRTWVHPTNSITHAIEVRDNGTCVGYTVAVAGGTNYYLYQQVELGSFSYQSSGEGTRLWLAGQVLDMNTVTQVNGEYVLQGFKTVGGYQSGGDHNF